MDNKGFYKRGAKLKRVIALTFVKKLKTFYADSS